MLNLLFLHIFNQKHSSELHLFSKKDNEVISNMNQDLHRHKINHLLSQTFLFHLLKTMLGIYIVGFYILFLSMFFNYSSEVLFYFFDISSSDLPYFIILFLLFYLLFYIQSYIFSSQLIKKYKTIPASEKYFSYFENHIQNLNTLPIYNEIVANKDNLYGVWLLYCMIKHINFHQEEKLFNYWTKGFYHNFIG